jgi:hypothetical protein
MNYGLCRRILATVLLMIFWKIPVFGEPPTTPPMSSEENGMRQYSEYEMDALIEDLSEAAREAIEQAAAEAARAAALASLDREMLALSEAQRLQGENSRLRQGRVKTAVVTGVVCFFGGLAIGAGGIALLQGVR